MLGWDDWIERKQSKCPQSLCFCVFFFVPFSFFYSCWWRLCGRLLRSLLSAERTWLSSHPLSMRIICLSPRLFPCKVESSLRYMAAHIHPLTSDEARCGCRVSAEESSRAFFLYACRGEGMFAHLSENNFGELAGGSCARLCAQTNKNIYRMRDTQVRRAYANTQAYRHATASLFLPSFLSVLPPPSSLQPSLQLSDWQLGRRGGWREWGRPWINEQANKWVQDR